MAPELESYAGLTIADFTDRLASADAVPGGGSASAIAGALAASLLAMVCRLSLDRPKYEQFRGTIEHALSVADRIRGRMLELADDDARAYAGYMEARRLPKDSADEQAARDAATRKAARQSSDAPLDAVRAAAQLMESIGTVAGRSNLNAASDLEVAARLCAAAAHGAAANVLINLPSVGDARYTGVVTAEIEGLLHGLDREVLVISQRVGRGSLRSPER